MVCQKYNTPFKSFAGTNLSDTLMLSCLVAVCILIVFKYSFN